MKWFILSLISCAILIGSSDYYCSHFECPDQVIIFCEYASPLNYTPFIIKKAESVRPWYNEYIDPIVSKANSQYIRVVSPYMMEVNSYWKEAISSLKSYCEYEWYIENKIIPEVYQVLGKLSLKYKVYRRRYISPIVFQCMSEIMKQYRKLIYKYPSIQKYIDYSYLIIKDLNGMVGLNFSKMYRKDKDGEVDDSLKSQIFENDSSSEKIKHSEAITYTVTKTITQTDEVTSSELTQSFESNDIKISFTDSIQEKLTYWEAAIERKTNDVLAFFSEETHEYELEELSKIKPYFANWVQNISNITHTHYYKINKAILDINCTTEIDVNGKKHFLDYKGDQLHKYISRELMRTLITDSKMYLEKSGDKLNLEIENIINNVNKYVEFIRADHLEIYEEWANIMMTEWSKQLVYADLTNLDGLDQKNNWKRFLKLKRQVIKTRELLHEYIVDFKDLTKFIKEIQFTFQALSHEANDYFYILRSKANIAFQQREAQEYAVKKLSDEKLNKTLIVNNSTNIRNLSIGIMEKECETFTSSRPQTHVYLKRTPHEIIKNLSFRHQEVKSKEIKEGMNISREYNTKESQSNSRLLSV